MGSRLVWVAAGVCPYTSPFGRDTDGVSLALFDLDKLPHVAIGKEQAVNADASPEGRALAEKLVATPFADQKELAARVRPLGYSIVPLTPGEGAAAAYREKLASPRAGRRQCSVRVKSAKGDHLVQVLDYSAGRRSAAARRRGSTGGGSSSGAARAPPSAPPRSSSARRSTGSDGDERARRAAAPSSARASTRGRGDLWQDVTLCDAVC